MKYLTRSNWVNSFPKTYEVEDGSRKAQASNELLNDLQVPTITDNESNYTMPDFNLISGNGELSLVNLNGRSYDDPYWEVLLNQMSKEDMYNLVRVGGYQTGAVASIGKPGTIDKDGSAGISSTLVGGKVLSDILSKVSSLQLGTKLSQREWVSWSVKMESILRPVDGTHLV